MLKNNNHGLDSTKLVPINFHEIDINHGSANLQDKIWGIKQVAAVLPVHIVLEAKVQEAELTYMENYCKNYSLDNIYVASLA